VERANPLLTPIFSALAAGTFIYLGTLHGLANGMLVARCCELRSFSLVVLGYVIMAVVAVWTWRFVIAKRQFSPLPVGCHAGGVRHAFNLMRTGLAGFRAKRPDLNSAVPEFGTYGDRAS